VVKIPKILTKFPLKTQKIDQNALDRQKTVKKVRASVFIQKSFAVKSVKTVGPAPNTYFS
jgi:hypothetical protein